jgi:ferredoxin-nitrite reductase
VFVRPEQAVELTRAIAQVFGELGDRENRWTCRLRYLVQELGPERFRAELEERAAFALTPAGEPLTRRYRGDHVGVHAQKQEGRSYVGLSVTVGRMKGENLVEAARLARAYGTGELRLATDQNLILVGVPDERLDGLLAEPLLAEHSPSPGPFERGVVACTGSEFCRFAIVETKVRAAQWARWLDRNVAAAGDGDGRHGDEIIRMHLSGCSASCAQPQIADIGLRGEVAHTDDAVVEAVDVGLGGSLGREAAFIDWVEGAKPAEEAPAGLLALVERWRAERRDGELFHQWCRRVPNAELRATLAGPGGPGGPGGSSSEAVAPRSTDRKDA